MRRATASSALANTVWAYAKAGLAADALFAAVAEAESPTKYGEDVHAFSPGKDVAPDTSIAEAAAEAESAPAEAEAAPAET